MVAELQHRVGQRVCVKGFVEAIREHKERLFLVVRDRTGAVQLLAERQGEQVASGLQELTRESAAVATGLSSRMPR